MKLTRRTFLTGIGAIAAGLGLGGYAIGYEPLIDLKVVSYRLTPPRWPSGLRLRLVALADLHACDPWMRPERIADIVARANALAPDIVVLLGDYVAGMRRFARPVPEAAWAGELARLAAPLGVHAILGNHDWWDDREAQRRGGGPTRAGKALAAAGIGVLDNDAVALERDGQRFWLAGLADQLALVRRSGPHHVHGLDDLEGTLAQVTDDAPVILLAHEPDIFPRVPERVSLTLSGHTHGGQVRVLGWSPVVPSDYGNRYAYGHVEEAGRHLVVSGGLGCSSVPLRFGVTPEINLIEIGGTA